MRLGDLDHLLLKLDAELNDDARYIDIADQIRCIIALEPTRVLYLCDLCGCKGCEEGLNEDNHCQHTSDIAHATNFDAVMNEDGVVFGYVEKPERFKPIAQVNFDDEKLKELSQEAARRMQDKIDSGELVLKSEVQKVIIHHNGRDTVGYYDRTRELLFGGFLTLDQCEKFGFTWTEVEEEDKNHES